MEKRLKRIEILLWLTLILVIIQTSYFLIRGNDTSNENMEKVSTIQKELPADITKDYTDNKIYDIKTSFNVSNWGKFYDVFGEYAQAQISKEELSEEFEKLKVVTGNIKTYAYSHYLYEGIEDGASWFEIYYKCRFDNGKGTIKLSTRTTEDFNQSEVVGVIINLDEL